MNIIAPINQLGYGITGLNIVKELSKYRCVSLWPIGQPQVHDPEDIKLIKNCIINSQTFEYDDPCIRIWHQHDMAQFVGNGEHIGFPIFELDTFKPVEYHQLNSVDRLFVCSNWAKEVCINNGIKPRLSTLDNPKIDVVPLGVDNQTFKPCEITDGPTIFFNCGKWEIRKGHDVLVEIFNRAFTDQDNVELWMMCDNPFLSTEDSIAWKRLYSSSDLGHKVKFISRVNTQNEVYNIMRKVDCGVFPSRAEGWNLEPLELMACGKHVIITDYSAHTEFCNNENAQLISIDSVEIARDNRWFTSDIGNWASIKDKEVSQAANHMRMIHELKQAGSLAINTSGVKTAEKFSWSNTVKEIMKYV